MVEFTQNVDANKKIYIPKGLREAGFSEKITIIPNCTAAVMFPANSKLEHVSKSLDLLKQEIDHRVECSKDK